MKSRGARSHRAGFTMVELIVASGAASILIGCMLIFMNFARVSVSGITAQTMVSDNTAQAVAFMQSRVRLATSVTTDAAGNVLTLGFDDDYEVDSNGDTTTYNDKDHWETFQFEGTNGTGTTTVAANKLTYTPLVGTSTKKVLVSFGMRNLPGYNIFSVPAPNAAVIRFGVVDPNGRDRFQSIDIQATGVSLNRPAAISTISIIP